MWLSFCACFIAVLLMLYLPGGLFLRQVNMRVIGSICFAPIISIGFYSIMELVLANIDITPTIPLLLGLTCSFLLFCVVVRGVLRARSSSSQGKGHLLDSGQSLDWPILLYATIGIIAVVVFFIKQLDGPDSFFQGWDNVTHLNGIRSLMIGGDLNPLSLNSFSPFDVSPYTEGPSFYPSALHVLCASVASVVGAAPAVALNAVNAVMIGLVFPLGFYQLISVLTNHNKPIVVAGSLLCLGNAVAPWDMLIYGPLFPNLFAFSFIPAVMASFILMCREISNSLWWCACRDCVVVFLGALTVFLGHPNGIFSLIVLLAPYLMYWGWGELKEQGISLLFRVVFAMAYLLFICVFWVVCYSLPMFSSVVGVSWPAINNSFLGAAADALLFSYVWRPENFLVSVLMAAGFFVVSRNRTYRWLGVSMITSQLFYAICAGTDGELKQLLTGFWYTDYYRVAALAAFAGSIVACFGLGKLFEWSLSCTESLTSRGGLRIFEQLDSYHLLPTGVFLIAGYLIFNANVVLPVVGHIELPLGYQAAETRRQYDKALVHYDVLTVEELAFVNDNRQLLGDGSTIINSPNDGSLFLYATDKMSTFYRSGSCPGPNDETEDSYLIRTRLYDIDSDERVKNAVRHIGAKYVLQLDYGERAEECRIFYNSYYPEDWSGIQLINEDTPGFTLLAKNQDMRIYRIDGV